MSKKASNEFQEVLNYTHALRKLNRTFLTFLISNLLAVDRPNCDSRKRKDKTKIADVEV